MLYQFDNEDLIKINQGLRVGEVLIVLERGGKTPGLPRDGAKEERGHLPADTSRAVKQHS